MDGTLLDSMGAWDNIGMEYLKLKGITQIPGNLKEILKPMSLLQAGGYFKKTFGIDSSPHQIMDDINHMIEDKYRYKIELKPGVREFLEKCSRYKKCVATETDKRLAGYALKRLGIENYFSFIITSGEVGGSKRSPEIFVRAAEKLGLAADEIIVFEDALHAVKSAKSAGFYVVGVKEDTFAHDKEEIQKAADYYVENLNEFEVKQHENGISHCRL